MEWLENLCPSPDKPNQKITFLLSKKIRKIISEFPKVKFSGMHGKGNTGLKFGIALHYGILNMGVSFEKGNSCSVEADSINCKMNENWTGWGLLILKLMY